MCPGVSLSGVMRVCFETFGCRLSKAEALQEEAEYLAAGWQVVTKHSEADLFIVRGCSVTARAQRECERLVEHLRRHYPNVRVELRGCIEGAKPKANPISSKVDFSAAVSTRTARAYLKVQDGCSGKCSFCIVPTFRGVSRSEDFNLVMDRAKCFIDAGYHEIVVVGCNLSLYASLGRRLPDLLSALGELGAANDCRIRLGSLEPGDCALDVVKVMAEQPSICNFLHIPVQSGCDSILKKMNRPYTIESVSSIIEEAERLMPSLGLGCDIITGFPGESELDFKATKTFVERHPFNNVHVFPYSERPGTAAAEMRVQIPSDWRSARAKQIASIVKTKRRLFAKGFVGKVIEVLIENEKENSGWTSEYLKCTLVGKAKRKEKYHAFVLRAHDDILSARLR